MRNNLERQPAGELMIWWTLFWKELRASSYKEIAEEVASEMVLGMIRRAGDEAGFHACPRRIPLRFRQEAFRIARRMSRGPSATDFRWEFVEDPNSDDRNDPFNTDPMTRIESVFKKEECERMLWAYRAGRVRNKDLAEAINMSERTFRSRLQRLRASR